MSIQFTAKDHKYVSINAEDTTNWISVTSFVKLFKPVFDAENAAVKACQNFKSKWYGMNPKEVIQIWDNETQRSLIAGSWYHNEREQELLMCENLQRDGRTLPVIRPLEQDGVKFAPDQNLTEGIYPEHLVFLKSAGICGQADRIEVVQNWVDVYDYKTNKEIKTEGFKNRDGVTVKMKGPLSHLDDCNFIHYALQLSIYMYIILKHNHNLKPRKLEIHHIGFEIESYDAYGYPIMKQDVNGNPIVNKVQPYTIPYLKREVQEMIKYVKNHPKAIKQGFI